MSTKLKIAGVVGARPNFMKIAPLASRLRMEPDQFEFILVHTGQHYDRQMNDVFFHELEIPEPDVHLGVGSGSHAEQTAKIILGFERVMLQTRPHLVIVVGDVNSTVAAALVASKLGIGLAHVEAGLRSRDRRMPEEINRIVTDTLSDLLFTPSRRADENLLAEGIAPSRICLVGNIMIDTLINCLKLAENRPSVDALGLKRGDYGIVTLHRPGNVDNPIILGEIIKALIRIARLLPIVLPVHPRAKKMLAASGLLDQVKREPGIHLVEPLGYLDFLSLMKSARLVISDSGGIQEETTYLRIPCLTLRENTERPETIEQGTNILVGHDGERIYNEALRVLEGRGKKGGALEFWDGKVAERIVAELKKRRSFFQAPPEERLKPEVAL
ncbi:MAG TPA: UDP-N-acetylglucosamine 2-epimerase (non-hydrolyzing) [archaeon]|nr:UDP-N-acetylglucosamine 2-epimerase (non-hydrolyzing) [archaeon]